MTKPKLKPCPFCGENEYEESSLGLWIMYPKYPSPYRIHCRCGVDGPCAATEAGAIRLWNRRKP
jgi:Lar family restriction alleviation protein